MGSAASLRRLSHRSGSTWLNGGHPSTLPRCRKARLTFTWHPPPCLAVCRSERPGSTAVATAQA
eukprot:5614012-Lingulodinium_polyedra.AAC.1